MESSITAPQATRPNLERTHSGNRTSSRGDKADAGKPSTTMSQSALAAQRATKYKEKFLAMKEKYEQVNATHTQYERELAQAAEKMRNLQNECNLLLDAVDIAVPGQPTLIHYLQHDPVPIHYTTASVPVAPEVIPVPIPVQVPMPMQVPIPQQPHPMPMVEPIQFIPHQPPNANGTNGHI